ncbi:hypothetical protein B0H14DRAFT_2605211 [Mycena olivaceomarginata]|nr:hypothetical protein B0H14DRAFT_2605211 [Mycena olivaceomarginata]
MNGLEFEAGVKKLRFQKPMSLRGVEPPACICSTIGYNQNRWPAQSEVVRVHVWILRESNPRHALVNIYTASPMNGARQPTDPFLVVFGLNAEVSERGAQSEVVRVHVLWILRESNPRCALVNIYNASVMNRRRRAESTGKYEYCAKITGLQYVIRTWGETKKIGGTRCTDLEGVEPPPRTGLLNNESKHKATPCVRGARRDERPRQTKKVGRLRGWVLRESNPRRALIFEDDTLVVRSGPQTRSLAVSRLKQYEERMDGARQPIDPFLSVFRDRIVWFHRQEANKCQPVSKVGTTSGINV